ncbi:hypothetical protein [Methylobacterium aquaticum]|uniref:hypothetical protein n=1 Tax=Methylobacterium aquaticum TaxID=270351 RepID=UPI0019323E2C|nr:hypothetical protein [Methylobacterium aquaticum]QRE72376.1 hypothetical protein F1D61_00460 [Methylobacterium aquaticum]
MTRVADLRVRDAEEGLPAQSGGIPISATRALCSRQRRIIVANRPGLVETVAGEKERVAAIDDEEAMGSAPKWEVGWNSVVPVPDHEPHAALQQSRISQLRYALIACNWRNPAELPADHASYA